MRLWVLCADDGVEGEKIFAVVTHKAIADAWGQLHRYHRVREVTVGGFRGFSLRLATLIFGCIWTFSFKRG